MSGALLLTLALLSGAAETDELVPQVTLGALDKITAQLTTLKAYEGQSVRFGTLEITLKSCRSNPPEETPESVAFLEIDDIGHNKKTERVFTGWMFASSPAISPLEHPVYDIWVTDCKMVAPQEPELPEEEPSDELSKE